MEIFLFVLIIITTILLNVLYHKIFGVVYFGLYALIREWFICFLIALLIVGGFLSPFVM